MSVEWVSPRSLTLSSLKSLLVGCEVSAFGDLQAEITHITEDSRRVRPGSLFVARKGETSEGGSFVASAMDRGACGVLCESASGVRATPRIEVAELLLAWGLCAQALFGDPSTKLRAVGVTGTNGKTTVACLAQQALNFLGKKVGRLGTLGFFIDETKWSDSLTTPQPDELAQYLAQAVAEGADSVILEVSSHALAQERTAGLRFCVAAFTNLSQDHLDYHGTMKAYGDAKARLFRRADTKERVLNIDDAMGRQLAVEYPDAFTISAAGVREARLRAETAEFGRRGLRARVQLEGQKYELSSPLIGRHNLENLLVAWGILHSLGVSPEVAVLALGAARGVPGRMERCDGEQDDIVVVVDYAHTPDALKRALSALQELSFSQVVCVFGCGGDRDRTKRALMGAIAAQHADVVYLSSDNPRSEDPKSIIEEVRQGFGTGHTAIVEADRHLAIEAAVCNAEAGAVVLIAGKGHEDYQIVGKQRLPFDDRVEAVHALRLRCQRVRS